MPTGLVVEHPLSHEPIPVWVGNYVLMGYGDGAVMGVPAHDERDFAFAKKYGIDMLQVIHVDGEHFTYDHWQDWYADKQRGVTHQLRRLQRPDLPGRGRRGRGRARAPRPRREEDRPGGCATGASAGSATGARRSRSSTATPAASVPVPEKDLPVVLPEDLIPDGSGNPLNKCAAFLNVACPTLRQAGAARDRHDGHLRRQRLVLHALLRPDSSTSAMVGAGTKYWMPMDQYIGGIEHAILHLLYARFWTKVMRDLELVDVRRAVHAPADAGHGAQPRLVARRRAQGGVDYFPPDEVDADRRRRRPADRRHGSADGSTVEYRGMLKMCKTKSNGVDPQEHDRPLRRRHRAPVRDVRLAARADARLERRRRRGREPLPAPPVEVRRASMPTRSTRAGAPAGARRRAGAAPRDPRGAAARSATTTSGCNTTPSSRAR